MFWLGLAIGTPIWAQSREKREALSIADELYPEVHRMSMTLWDYSEIAMREYESAEYLADILEREGFTLERGVAEMPTAFVATYGQGKPVIGILGEYDALPGLSQKVFTPRKEANTSSCLSPKAAAAPISPFYFSKPRLY